MSCEECFTLFIREQLNWHILPKLLLFRLRAAMAFAIVNCTPFCWGEGFYGIRFGH